MKYPLPLRLIHWTMAVIILGMVWVGWKMVSLPENAPIDLYPWHKSFGLLALLLVIVRLTTRLRLSPAIPALPAGLAPWEKKLSKAAHVALYTLMIVVPCMGYAMSSSYTQSDGVTFFGIPVPELLPKNDARFEVFQALHRWLAYTLLALVVLHVAGALKHRLIDRDRANDVLSKMI
jgi:cytochrome b561